MLGQIFFLAEMGKPIEDLAKSVFVEKLDARGYEVLLLNEPLDEIMVQNVRQWKCVNSSCFETILTLASALEMSPSRILLKPV